MTVRSDVQDRVAWLTLDRQARRNALTASMWAELAEHLDAVENGAVAAVVLGGAGGAFSAGADLDELRGSHAAGLRHLAERTILRVRDLPVPTFALIEGSCLGAGCSLALACDIRVCAPSARFGIPALRNGLVYEDVYVRRLVELVGEGAAGLLLLGGERWSGAEALAHGLVERCVEDPTETIEALVAGLREARAATVAATVTAIRCAARRMSKAGQWT
ncbi:enoyl-CoA hydratase/isomerase family protein [Pseudonocardia halophobica]|uniref:Enoyl-CoA hydratase n=1 Tax=Pseudonocardia halophobica TaxID=29401 RepID=A0A9W6NYL1_9PSEU|nr:enoyl-CoA hydratase/isomerase family protein [Pseudonocardia halophobica]GLL13994.1 enoyl-CoA hydratase [Pseudonocardia halophobica]